MKKIFFGYLMCFLVMPAHAQFSDFEFGKIRMPDVNLKVYEKDSTANAVVLNEYGRAHIDSETFNLVFRYHVRIKILNKDGVEHATFTIPLRKQDNQEEIFRIDEASTFAYIEGRLVEDKLDRKSIFMEDSYKYMSLCKFTMPNVQEGSIIDVRYHIESPFVFNFRPWDFQSGIPKLISRYHASIPGNYVYNIALKGFLKLDINESSISKDCFGRGTAKADCAELYFGMDHVPAFKTEEYMTAPSNFISSVQFELSEVRRFDGVVNKITRTWKDVETELKNDDHFGKQMKKGKDVFRKDLDKLIGGETDPEKKAVIIYDYIKRNYKWNEYYGKYSETGIKKVYDQKSGNVGDINLSLIAALQAYGFDAQPVLSSTRENGLPLELYPILSDFNYVFCRVEIRSKTYTLDATDPDLPFGMLPVRCINGKGRVLDAKESYWMDITPAQEMKQLTVLLLKLEPDGKLKGNVIINSSGYDALLKRKKIRSYNSHDEYIEDVDKKFTRMDIKDYRINNLDDLSKPVSESYQLEMDSFDSLKMNRIHFNPFIFDKWSENPFKSSERFYPVDFGTPLSYTFTLNFEYPESYKIIDMPKGISLVLPDNGGRFTLEIQQDGNRIIMRTLLKTNKYIYDASEYHTLRELFARIVQLHKTDIILEKEE